MKIDNISLSSDQIIEILGESYTFRRAVAEAMLAATVNGPLSVHHLKADFIMALRKAVGEPKINKIAAIKWVREYGAKAEYRAIFGDQFVAGTNYLGLAESKNWVEKEFNI